MARTIKADPEIAVRLAAGRFRERVERAEALALENGESFDGLDTEAQLAWYRAAKDALATGELGN